MSEYVDCEPELRQNGRSKRILRRQRLLFVISLSQLLVLRVNRLKQLSTHVAIDAFQMQLTSLA